MMKMKKLRQMLCRHNTVRVVRWHRDCVTEDMDGKQLYVDRYDVHNFVRCCNCGKFLETGQIDKLFEQKKAEE